MVSFAVKKLPVFLFDSMQQNSREIWGVKKKRGLVCCWGFFLNSKVTKILVKYTSFIKKMNLLYNLQKLKKKSQYFEKV